MNLQYQTIDAETAFANELPLYSYHGEERTKNNKTFVAVDPFHEVHSRDKVKKTVMVLWKEVSNEKDLELILAACNKYQAFPMHPANYRSVSRAMARAYVRFFIDYFKVLAKNSDSTFRVQIVDEFKLDMNAMDKIFWRELQQIKYCDSN
jgi:hypothetical protein